MNGGEAEILEIGYKRVRFRDGEREFGLALDDPQLRHLDHAYCTTVHAAQGKTARAAIAVLDAGGAADRALFHVEISRVTDEFLLLTDDREALIELIEARMGSEDGALEALGFDPAQIPVVDPEVFAALAADWRAIERRAGETNTVPFFLPGYREVMARAAVLAAIDDLPADMRSFVDRMLEEHREHLSRDREVWNLSERIREHWRRWPELGWVAPAEDEHPRYDAWREESEALLEEGRDRLAAEGEAARHLNAMPGARDGLAGALETLERTRVLDDARRFEGLWRELRERAARDGIPELLAEGYGQVAELGARLAAAEGLDPQRLGPVEELRRVHAAQTALAEEVRTLPDRVAAWRERRAVDLPLDERGGLDPAHPARHAWREEGVQLEAGAEDMLRPEDAHAPYLDAVPRAREAVRQAVEEVVDALDHDRLGGVRVADVGGAAAGAEDRDRAVPPAALRRDDRGGAGGLRLGGIVGKGAGGCPIVVAISQGERTALQADSGLAGTRGGADRQVPGTSRAARLPAGMAAEGGAAARRGARDAGG